MKKIALTLATTVALGSWTARAQQKVDFAKDIEPILQKSCIKCHGPEKQKGKLRLDTKEGAFKPGAEHPAFVSGSAEKSEAFRRINLPKDDDDHMPSEGDPLTKEQIQLIKDWINQGAEWTVAKLTPAEGTATAATPAAEKPISYTPWPGEQKAISDLEATGISVRPIAMNVPWRQASLNLLGTNITDKTLVSLKEVGSLVDLNLAGTKISDQGLANLSVLTNLNRLHLEKTQVTDAGLASLKPLVNLAYLNLYNTSVTDAGLDQLKGLTNLKSVYLWQTKVTDAGVAELQKALPKVQISRGWDLTPPPKAEEKKEAKAEEKKDAKVDEKKESKPQDQKDAAKEEKKEDKDSKK